jgi:hypothetical protein
MDANQRVKELQSWESVNDFRTTDLVRERFNCREAEIDSEGTIWIRNGYTSRWLTEDETNSFLAWVEARS